MRQSSQLGGNTIQFHSQLQLRGLLTFFSQESVVVNEYLYRLDSYFQQSNYPLVFIVRERIVKNDFWQWYVFATLYKVVVIAPQTVCVLCRQWHKC